MGLLRRVTKQTARIHCHADPLRLLLLATVQTMMALRSLTYTFRFVGHAALPVIVCAASALASALPGALETGLEVTIKPFEGRSPLTARVIQVGEQQTEPVGGSAMTPLLTLRAHIEVIDQSSSRLHLLGRTIIVDGSTRAPATMSSIADLKIGQWIKAKIDTLESGQWHAQRIETTDIEPRTKIEGTIVATWPDSISVGGLVVHVPGNVRLDRGALTPSERIFSDLLTPQDPRQPVPWFSQGWLWSRGKIGVNQRIENDFSVGDSAADHYREAEPSLRLELTARGPAGMSAFLKLRSRTTLVWENAPLRKRPHEAAVELYEGYVLWRDILAMPVALQIGRQDFDEYREWIFDDQLDAIRAYAYPFYPITVEAAYINSLDNSPENKFRTLSDYLLHIHGRPVPSTELGVYRLWRTDDDARGREPVWTGVRWRGSYFGVRPWVDLAWLRGWDKGRRFDASAYDVGTTISKQLGSHRISATVASAHSTGNDDDPKATGIDRQFRQTGYEDNTGAYDGVTSFQYYGEVFDPELANLDILTIGAGATLAERASVDVVYHRYNQSEYAEGVSRDLEGTDLTLYDYGGRGIDPDNNRPVKELFPYQKVGWELDVIVGLVRVFGLLDIKWVTGFFVPEDALSPPFWEQLPFRPKKRTSYLNQLSIEYRF